MKILQVIYLTGYAGAEKNCIQLTRLLSQDGHKVSLLAFYDNEKTIDQFNKRLNGIDCRFLTIQYKNIFQSISSFTKLLKQLPDFEIINSHLFRADIILAISKIFSLKISTIVSTKHGYKEAYVEKYKFRIKKNAFYFYRQISKIVCKKFNRNYAVSNTIKNLYVGLGILDESKTDVIHHAITLNLNNEKTKKRFPQKNGNKIKILTVGRLLKLKGIEYSIKAVKHLIGTYDIHYDIVGDGPHRKALEKLVKKYSLEETVIFHGFRRDVDIWYEQCDIVLLPVLSEAFGLVFLEAMSHFRPVIGFDLPAANEVVEHNVTGFLAKERNIDEIVEYIQVCVNNPKKIKRLCSNAYVRLTDYYCEERLLSQLNKFYKKSIETR